MKSFVQVLALVALFVSGRAEGQDKGAPKPHKKEISIYYPFSDWMFIYDDGSGTVGFGAGGTYQIFFKAGTFDYDQVEKELRALKTIDKKDTDDRFSFSFREIARKEDKIQYVTAERKYITGLFEKGIEARNRSGDRLEGYGPFLLGRLAGIRIADTWVVESAEFEGKPVAELKGLKLTITSPSREPTMTETIDGKEQKASLVTASNQFHLGTYLGGASNSVRVQIHGVYALDGDELRIRRSGSPKTITGIIWDPKAKQPEEQKIKSLDSKEGTLIVLKRVVK